VRFAAVVVVAASFAGCTNAVTLEIASDRPVPRALDSICVGVAAAKDQFGRGYRLDTRMLPQTLRVDGPPDTIAWVRGDQGGVATQLVSAPVDGDTTLDLRACVKGPGAAPAPVGAPVGPASARLAASEGLGGTVVVAVGATASLLDASGRALVASDLPAPPPGKVTAVIAADLDGDCDDDVIIATDGAAPTVWIRDGKSFTPGDAIGSVAAQVAAADIDHDGDTDLVLGYGSTLQLWLNDGGAHFTQATSALTGGGHVSAVSALAMADLDGDGNADLVVGQNGAPLAAWLGTGGTFDFNDGAVPPVTLAVERLTLADANGDFAPDLAIAVTGAPMRLLVNRGDGRLEDRTFVTLASPPTIHAAAFGGWDDGCEPDAAFASDAGTPTLHGQPGGAFAADSTTAPAATDVLFYDIDDNGALDALFATAQGVQWLAR
jgi:FG-GAP-like repeat